MILYISIWCVWSVICAALAYSKNTNVFFWLILGFMLGPLAFIVLAFKDNSQKLDFDLQTKKCSFCAEQIKEEAIKCKHCGEKQLINAVPVEEKNKFELHDAVWSGNYSEVISLLADGADVNIKNDVNKSPLELAAERKDRLIAKVLIKHGAHESS